MLRKLSSISATTVLVLSFVGCESREPISTYTIPRTNPPKQPTDVEQAAKQFDHMLAAIVPQGNQAWFFKLTAPAPAIDRHRDAFLSFLAKVTIDDSKGAKKPVTWQLPEGWKERGPSEMRVDTLVIPDESGPLELSVTTLPLSGDWNDYLVRNVNRWMGQLSQGPLDADTVSQLVKEIPVQGGKASWVELVGTQRKSLPGMMSAPKSDGTAEEKGAKDEKSTGRKSAATSHSNAPLAFEVPADWLPGRLSAMRKAAFRVVDGENEAEVTVIDLPAAAGGQSADVAANIRRWAGQVGLGNLDDEAVERLISPIEIDGLEGTYAELNSPKEAASQQSMRVAMVMRGGKVWFFKLVGEPSVVSSQTEAFRQFLTSVKFK